MPNSAFQNAEICESWSSSMLVSRDSVQNAPTVHVAALDGSFDCRRISCVQVRCWFVILFGVLYPWNPAGRCTPPPSISGYHEHGGTAVVDALPQLPISQLWLW